MKRSLGDERFEASTYVRDAQGALVDIGSLRPLPDIAILRARLPMLGGESIEARLSAIPGAGRGLFATRAFAKGELVTAYDGPVIHYLPMDQLPRRYQTHARVLAHRAYTVIGNHPAAHLGEDGYGGGALTNHAPRPGMVNAEYSWVDSERNRPGGGGTVFNPFQRLLVIKATKAIKAGEEVLCSYGETYWDRQTDDDVGGDDAFEPVLLRPEDYNVPKDEPATKKRRITLTPMTHQACTHLIVGSVAEVVGIDIAAHQLLCHACM